MTDQILAKLEKENARLKSLNHEAGAIIERLREAQRCGDCKHRGKYENEREYGYPSPCTLCARRAPDNFEPLPEPPKEE